MGSKGRARLAAGRQPYDPLNGFRVGALAGGLLGAVAAAVSSYAWLILVGAAVGGGIGFWSEYRKLRNDRSDTDSTQKG